LYTQFVYVFLFGQWFPLGFCSTDEGRIGAYQLKEMEIMILSCRTWAIISQQLLNYKKIIYLIFSPILLMVVQILPKKKSLLKVEKI
jgi:hypothetical protein